MFIVYKFSFVLLISCIMCNDKSDGIKSNKTEEIKIQEKIEPEIIENEFTIEYVMGKFDPKTHTDFTEIPLKYADQTGRLMRKDALESFIKMADAASNENIKLVIKSATRNFDYQKGIWERKWKGETKLEDGTKASDIKDEKERALKILKYSSMPGTSRHHWGTDIDINDFENAFFSKGEGKKLYEWMLTNAHSYGYCQVYNEKGKNRKTGYNEERWHWSYMPVSSKLTVLAAQELKNEMITGFLGARAAVKVDMVNNFVLAVNKDCR